MGETVESIAATLTRLRRTQADTLSAMSPGEMATTLAALAKRWRDPSYPRRQEAARWQEPFPFVMVQVSLDALLDSLTVDEVSRLMVAEGVGEASGLPVIGHVIAGNTPLLAWVSVLRALLVRSASFVKLPSGPAAEWGRLFHRSLSDISPALAHCVHMAQWAGGTEALDAALCTGADLMMAHGSDTAIKAINALCPPSTPFIGYGHRVSFGVVPPGLGIPEAAVGFAKDILLYDQGGCLSPQTIYVEGGGEAVLDFSSLLASALAQVSVLYPLPVRSERAAAAVREARLLARMEPGNRLWEDPNLRWTVIARPHSRFAASPTFGVVSVQPLGTPADLPEALTTVAGRLQGCAVAGQSSGYLPGVSRICAPGSLQSPPLSWRQDGRDVLRCLLA